VNLLNKNNKEPQNAKRKTFNNKGLRNILLNTNNKGSYLLLFIIDFYNQSTYMIQPEMYRQIHTGE
jgi:hypothetical protein